MGNDISGCGSFSIGNGSNYIYSNGVNSVVL